MHEAQMTEEQGNESCFITLTYSDDQLPFDLGLHHEHFQDFMKRFRRRIDPIKIRYYMCGEYGEQFGRPHYHAIIFGYDFPDKYAWATQGEKQNYRSDELEELWPKGHSLIGPCNIQTAGYTARYIMKKAMGEQADEIYKQVGLDGVLRPVKHEYTAMSKGQDDNKGIGYTWYQKYKSDCEKDFLTLNGKKFRIPAYYDKLLAADNSEKAKRIKQKRKALAAEHADNNTPDRLAVREHCTKARAEKLVRPLEL